MSSHPYHPPHKTLGKYLKTMRQRLQESLGETSGAVEIEVEMLDRIERGELLPSEDILLLLISHFSLKEDEAVELWKLAGYDQNDDADSSSRAHKAAYMVMLAFDTRVLYSNHSAVEADESGVTISFMQPTGADQSMPVSRIGMSYDQAERLAARLQTAVLKQRYLRGPKQLQSPVPKQPPLDPNDPLKGPQPPQAPPGPSIAPKPPKPWTPPRPDEPDKV